MMDHFTDSEIQHDIDRVRAIINCGIFDPNNSGHPLRLSALTELMICLRDLMAKCVLAGSRITFCDHVIPMAECNDVTDAIKFVRDALCHMDSSKHNLKAIQARITFNTVYGKMCLMQVRDLRIENPYDDDIAFFLGPQRLFLKRHIMRAFEEAVALLQPPPS